MTLSEKITNSRFVRALTVFTKRNSFIGLEKVPLYDVVQLFIKGIREGAINIRAASLAYYFFLALFPLVIFLFTLIPYIPVTNFQEQIFDLLKSLLPENAYLAIEDTIHDIVARPNKGLLSFGFFAALYFSTSGFSAMIDAFNNTIHIDEKTGFFKLKLKSLLLVIVTTTVLFAAVTTMIYSEYLLKTLFKKDNLFELILITVGQWLIVLTLFYFSISLNYNIGSGSQQKWKFFSAGSTLATFGMIVTSFGFTFYINNFSTYNKLYGSIGTLIVIMLWLYINAFILLLGYELNASIHSAKKK